MTVSPDSQVIVFSGNLLKAPPLNRRGRKVNNEYSPGKINFLHIFQNICNSCAGCEVPLHVPLRVSSHAYYTEQLTTFGHEVVITNQHTQGTQCMLGKEHFWLSTLLMFLLHIYFTAKYLESISCLQYPVFLPCRNGMNDIFS